MPAVFRSLSARIILILVGGILTATLLTLGLAYVERQSLIREFRQTQVVERVAQFAISAEKIAPELRPAFLQAAKGIGVLAEQVTADVAVMPARSDLAELVADRLPEGYRVASAAADPGLCPLRQRSDAGRPFRCEPFLVTLPGGDTLRLVAFSPQRPPAQRPGTDFLTQSLLFMLCIAVLAALVARMATAPIKRLAQAATELGKDIGRPPLPEQGATEIRQAAAAFNAMQARIQRHLRQQTHMLAAITHDLQTPLTRLRLRLEKVEDEELRTRLVADLAAMQSMVREGLELARSTDSAEALQTLNLDSLIDSVCTDAQDAGLPVRWQGSTGTTLQARPLALRRCLDNLIDNAVKYGGSALVEARRSESGTVTISVRDSGPGIPETELGKVFDPFYRLESSRSRQTGGTGLGLAIARNIAEQHGGKIELRNLPQGGLEAMLTLPA